MTRIRLRSFQDVQERIGKRGVHDDGQLRLRIAREVVDWIPQETVSLSDDFCLLSMADAIVENRERHDHGIGLGQSWWLIAKSGNGDAWIVPLNGSDKVFFLDHDVVVEESIVDMHLSMSEWVLLADLCEQVDRIQSVREMNDDERDDFRRELERLSAGLSERYPYAF